MIDLTGLNQAQNDAVTSNANKILCLAGAGTGKTRVLTHRIARLFCEGISCDNMLALTFTRLAGVEMKERIIKLIGAAEGTKLFCNTFHAFCVEVLQNNGSRLGYDEDFSIIDQTDQEAVVKSILNELGYNKMSLKKALEALKGSYLKGSKEDVLQKEYYFRLKQNNAIDFDSLIGFTTKLFLEYSSIKEEYRSRYPYVFIDEFQDTSDDQWELITLLQPENIFIVGDDFQGIYGWRSANIQIILNLAKNPSYETIKLEENYRSTIPIVSAANTLIKKNTQTEKVLRTAKEGSDIKVSSYINEETEILGIKNRIEKIIEAGNCGYRDIAVLARTNKQLETVATIMSDIPHILVNSIQDPMKSGEVKLIFNYMEAAKNIENDSLIKKIINYPTPVLTDTEMFKIEVYQLEHNISFYDALQQSNSPKILSFFENLDKVERIIEQHKYEPLVAFKEIATTIDYRNNYTYEQGVNSLHSAMESIGNWEAKQQSLGSAVTINDMLNWYRLRDIQDKMTDDKNEVKLMTVHASKGLEFETVFVIGMNQDTFPSRGDIEEERRLFYVAITRAKKHLFISRAKKRLDWSGNEVSTEESQFLQEI